MVVVDGELPSAGNQAGEVLLLHHRRSRGTLPGLQFLVAQNVKIIGEYRHHEFDDRVATGNSTLKDDGFTIRAVQTAAINTPFDECQVPAEAPMQKLVGLTMGPGWRKAIEGAIGGVAGCTHLRELVFNAATAAFQMIPHYRATEGGRKDDMEGMNAGKPPFYMGKCMTWSFEGPVVQRLAPQFYRGKKAG